MRCYRRAPEATPALAPPPPPQEIHLVLSDSEFRLSDLVVEFRLRGQWQVEHKNGSLRRLRGIFEVRSTTVIKLAQQQEGAAKQEERRKAKNIYTNNKKKLTLLQYYYCNTKPIHDIL